MRNHSAVALGAVTLVAALGLGGCSSPERAAPPPSLRTTMGLPTPTAPTAAAFPPPDALSGVLYRLTDPAIPAQQKMALVEYATVDDQPALANFGEALKANGFNPLTIQVTDLTWAGEPGHIVATVTMGSPDPKIKPVTIPMEFSPMRNFWQLSRRTADQLLPLAKSAQPAPPMP